MSLNISSIQEIASPDSSATGTVTANQAYYIPFHLERSSTIRRIAFRNTDTGTDNIDVGIYDLDGTKRVSSGSTARQGSTGPQWVDITDEDPLPRGRYYMAFASQSGGSIAGMVAGGPIGNRLPMILAGVKIESSAFPLPSSATFADPSTTDKEFPWLVLVVDA